MAIGFLSVVYSFLRRSTNGTLSMVRWKGRLSEASPTCRMLSCERKILRSFLSQRGWYIRDGYRSSLTSSKENNACPGENLNRLVTSIRSLCRPTTHFTPTLGLNVTLRYTLCN